MPSTAALAAARRNLTRAGYFIDLHEGTQEGAGTPNNKRRELPRAAVTFAIGALDSYLSEVAAEVMVAQFENGSTAGDVKRVLENVQKAVPTLAIQLAVAGPNVDRAKLLQETIVAYFYDQVSNHGAKAVSAAVQRMGKSPNDLWGAVEAAGEATAQVRLDDWTQKRHAIVHRGQSPQINRQPAKDCIALVETICLEVDKLAVEAKTP